MKDTNKLNELAKKAKTDNISFEKLCKFFTDHVSTFIKPLSDRAYEVEDYKQIIRIIIWKSLDKYDGIHNYYNFINRLITNEIINIKRCKNSNLEFESLMDDPLNENYIAWSSQSRKFIDQDAYKSNMPDSNIIMEVSINTYIQAVNTATTNKYKRKREFTKFFNILSKNNRVKIIYSSPLSKKIGKLCVKYGVVDNVISK